MTTFKEFISRSSMLDIKIQNADKYFTSQKKIDHFLDSKVTIEHKTDGVKLTVIKASDNEYICAYKGNILYNGEFDYQPDTKAKSLSIANSQFKFALKHFQKLEANNIPVGTEFFIEYLMRKPTLSSSYTTLHKMVLLGYSESTWDISFGKLKTSNSGLMTEKRSEYAKLLNIHEPQLLFSGYLRKDTIEKGFLNKEALKVFREHQNQLTFDNLYELKSLFLEIPSRYGGLEEGVVITFDDITLKWQQAYQNNQSLRFMNKQKYRESTVDKEQAYWNNVNTEALKIVNSLIIKSRPLKELLSEASLIIKRLKIDFSHSSKVLCNIKDDIQQTTKTQIIKKMRGNNNSLVVGKFRVITKDGHYKMIKQAKTLFDNCVVCLIKNKNSSDLSLRMLKSCFPNVKIITAPSANLKQITYKSDYNINTIYAGTDRAASYREQVKNTLGLEVKEIQRTANDISATKVIDNIHDKAFFLKNTPEQIHEYYEELKDLYGSI